MIVDRARAEVLQHRSHERGEDQRQPCSGLAGKRTRKPRDAGEKDQQQRGRPDRHCHRLGTGCRHHQVAGPNEGRERQIDQPRPVHPHALGRSEPVLGQVEPALAAEEIPHLDEPHGVIGREVGIEASDQVGRDCRDPDDDEQDCGLAPLARNAVVDGCWG